MKAEADEDAEGGDWNTIVSYEGQAGSTDSRGVCREETIETMVHEDDRMMVHEEG